MYSELWHINMTYKHQYFTDTFCGICACILGLECMKVRDFPFHRWLSLGLCVQPVFISASWHWVGLAQQLGYHCSLHDAADGRSRISVGLESTPHSTSTLHWAFSKHNLSKGLDCKKKYGIPWMKVAGCVCDDEIKPVTWNLMYWNFTCNP